MKNILFIITAVFFLIAGCNNSTEDSVVSPGSGNSSPRTPSSPVPANGTLITSGSFVTLQWTCSDPDAGDSLKYTVYFDNNSSPTTVLAADIINPAKDVGRPGPGATYYWKIVAKDNHGHSTSGPVWSFTTTSD